MKIAIVSSLFAPFALGGAEQVAEQLAIAFQDAGHQVDIITTCRRDQVNGDAYVFTKYRGMRVWKIAPWNLYWRYDRECDHPGALRRAAWHFVDLWNPTTARPLLKVLSLIQPDVINSHNIDGLSPVVWQVARTAQRPVVHTVHDGHLLCPRAIMQRRDGRACEGLCGGCRVYAGFHARFQRYVDAVISPSKDLAELHCAAGWDGRDLNVVPNAVPFEDVTLEAVEPSTPLRVLFLARLVQEKGCAVLLESIRRFAGNPGLEFHVAGSGPFADEFAALATEAANLKFHGHVSGAEKSALLAKSDVLLVLSQWRENAPLSLLEGKLHGLYVIATRMGGIPEMVGPGDGELIPAAAGDALCGRLRDLIGRREALRELRRSRIDRARGYGVREMADRYVKIFEQLVGRTAATDAPILTSTS